MLKRQLYSLSSIDKLWQEDDMFYTNEEDDDIRKESTVYEENNVCVYKNEHQYNIFVRFLYLEWFKHALARIGGGKLVNV